MPRFLLVLLLSLFVLQANAQTFIINPPTVAGKTKILFQPGDQIDVTWGKSLSGASLKIGTTPGDYSLASLAVSGTGTSFKPSDLGLTTGVYYAIITNASSNTLAGIQAAFGANPGGIDYSPEFPLVVESASAPSVNTPRGSIQNATPTFDWDAVPGVAAYVIFLSSTPFQITRDANNELVVEGANIIWQFMTTNTSATYGETNPNSPLPNLGTPPPLTPGSVYNYTILNAYSETDLAFLSDVFGTIISFTYDVEQTLDAPVLVGPADGAEVFGEETVTFDWDPVAGANNYSLYLFERIRDGGTEIDLQIWNTTTTNTLVDFSAKSNLKRGTYVWYVIPSDDAGAGTASATQVFDYVVDMGEFRYTTKSAEDGTNLIGVSVQARSLEGGYNPTNPFINNDGTSLTDSLVAGLYEFEATKDQYQTTTTVIDIKAGQRINFTISMAPLPSRITGLVQDETGEPVGQATVTLTNSATGVVETATSSNDGLFSADLGAGAYEVIAAKAGYLPSEEVSAAVDINQQLDIAAPLVVINDAVTVSGKVLNQSGDPVQLAIVKATGPTTEQVTTNSTGDYSFTLSSGNWTFEVDKDGFVSPDPEVLLLAAGENLQNQNFTLQERANQISGTVFEVVTQADGQTDLGTFAGATITATPATGTPVITTAGSNGAYTLNLAKGTYEVLATAPGFSRPTPVMVVVNLDVAQTIDGVDFELVPNSGTLSGQVIQPDGSALEGATVSVTGIASTTSSSSGSYALSVPPGTWTISVALEGFVAPESRTVSVSAETELSGLDFTLTPNAGVLSGLVTSAGATVADALVTATSGSETVTTMTNASGAFTLSVASGTWTVVATKSGFAAGTTRTTTVSAGQESNGIDFDLVSNTAFVEGSVTDGAAAVRGATVTVTATDGSGGTQSSVTRVDGGFSLALTSGTGYTVTVRKDGFQTATASTAMLSAGQTATLSIVMVPSPAAVSGRVRDAAQRALSGATITVRSGNSVIETATTAVDGTYAIGLAAGSYTMEAELAGYQMASQSLSLSLGQELTDFDLTLVENFATLTGSVKDDTATPVADALVNLVGGTDGGSARTGSDGAYIITGLFGGAYDVTVERDGFGTFSGETSVSAGKTKTFDVTLTQLNGTVTGTVTDAAGQAVGGATVTAIGTDGTRKVALTNETGAFTLQGLPLDTYTVTATRSGYSSGATQSLTLTSEATEAVVTISDMVANSAALAGVVRDASTGEGLLDVTVTATGDVGTASTETSSTGAYSLDELAPGTYTVSTSKSGYSSTATTVTVEAGAAATQDLEMRANTGRITGRVVDGAGAALPFTVTVEAFTGATTFTTTTDASGNFSFDELAGGLTYTVSTDIFREGYGNATATAELPSTDNASVSVTLTVPVNTAQITGTVGTSKATIQLLDASGGVIRTSESLSDGSYALTLLSAGTYTVTVAKQGFTFSPATRTVTLATGAAQTANFTVSTASGTLTVTLTESGGQARSGITVSVVSEDGTVVRSAVSGSTGEAVFADLPSGRYIVQPLAVGLSITPASRTVDVAAGATASAAFTVVPGTAVLSGTVRDTGGQVRGSAALSARRTSTGTVFRTTAANNGTYEISGLPGGTYELVATLSGFLADTLVVTLADGEQRSSTDLTLSALNVTLTGSVTFAGAGVPGVTVTATASSRLTGTTNANGVFRIAGVPVSPSPDDTTTYEVRITGTDITPQSRIVPVAGRRVGQTVSVGTFILPSGQIALTFTDGLTALEGVVVELTTPSGEVRKATADRAGRYASSQSLRKGTYRVSLTKSGFLRPSAAALQFELGSDEAVIDETIALPYRHTPPATIPAGGDTAIRVRFARGFDPGSGTEARLYYRRANQQAFTRVVMTRQDTLFTGTLPAQFSQQDLTYYVDVVDAVRGITYNSIQRTLTPTAVGILSTVRLAPALKGVRLREGENYAVSLSLRDGVGTSLKNDFLSSGVGRITWTSSDPALVVTVPDPSDSTTVVLQGNTRGTYTLTVRARLRGTTVTTTASVNVVAAALKTLSVASPVSRLSNRALGIQMALSAADTSGASVLMGQSLNWSVAPASVAEITTTGFLRPTDPNFIGPLTVTATDATSGLVATAEVAVFARLNTGISAQLHNAAGLMLDVPVGALPFTAEIGLTKARQATPKKYSLPGGVAYTAADRLYKFTFRADRALPGDSLAAGATLTLPPPPSLRLHEGEQVIGRFNLATVNWWLLPTQATADGPTTSAFRSFGEYGVLAANEPLGLRHVAVLPNPFSPTVAPLKIGYYLSTPAPPARVTIRIFNLRGELVRTLLTGDAQFPGRYGSRTGLRELTWDGRTDNGDMARNGRYIVEVRARDTTGEVVEMIPVVLIK